MRERKNTESQQQQLDKHLAHLPHTKHGVFILHVIYIWCGMKIQIALCALLMIYRRSFYMLVVCDLQVLYSIRVCVCACMCVCVAHAWAQHNVTKQKRKKIDDIVWIHVIFYENKAKVAREQSIQFYRVLDFCFLSSPSSLFSLFYCCCVDDDYYYCRCLDLDREKKIEKKSDFPLIMSSD